MFRIILTISILAILGGCTDPRVRDRFNFNYETPNEFEVQKKPELIIPKDDKLPEPQISKNNIEE